MNLPHQANHKTTIEYAGFLPVYIKFGDCGNHPQFLHIQIPPNGYRFTTTYDPLFEYSINPLTRLFRRAIKIIHQTSHIWPKFALALSSLWHGAQLKHILKFLNSRDKQSQLMLPIRSNLVFLPSVPFTYNQHPWVIEIEDCISLFFPYIHNGDTQNINFLKSPYYPILKALLESQNCRGIITHIHSTAIGIPKLFRNKLLKNKIFHIPLGVHFSNRYANHSNPTNYIELLFTNSWHQNPNSFYLRGGLDVLDAFKSLSKKYPNLRLTLRTLLPENLEKSYLNIIEKSNVRVIDKFLSKEEMEDLSIHSHIFLIPSARIHVVSVLTAMAYGLAVIASDGWGMEDYVKHEENGLIVKGRYGKVTWNDATEGTLRENYHPMFSADPKIADQLMEHISRLVKNPSLRAQLGRNARQTVKNNFNIDIWNQHLEDALNKALKKDRP